MRPPSATTSRRCGTPAAQADTPAAEPARRGRPSPAAEPASPWATEPAAAEPASPWATEPAAAEPVSPWATEATEPAAAEAVSPWATEETQPAEAEPAAESVSPWATVQADTAAAGPGSPWATEATEPAPEWVSPWATEPATEAEAAPTEAEAIAEPVSTWMAADVVEEPAPAWVDEPAAAVDEPAGDEEEPYDVAALLAASAAWATPEPSADESTAGADADEDILEPPASEELRAPVPLGEAYPQAEDTQEPGDESPSSWALASDSSVTWTAADVAAADELAVTEPVPVVDPRSTPDEPVGEPEPAAAAAWDAPPAWGASPVDEDATWTAEPAEPVDHGVPAHVASEPEPERQPVAELVATGPSASPAWAAEMDADPEMAAVRAGLQAMLAELSANVPDIAGAVLATRDGLPLAATIDDADVERIAAMTASVLGLSRRAVAVLDHGELWDTVLRFQNAYLLVYPAGRPAALCVAARSWRNIGLVDHEARRAAARFASLVAADPDGAPSDLDEAASSPTHATDHPTTDSGS